MTLDPSKKGITQWITQCWLLGLFSSLIMSAIDRGRIIFS